MSSYTDCPKYFIVLTKLKTILLLNIYLKNEGQVRTHGNYQGGILHVSDLSPIYLIGSFPGWKLAIEEALGSSAISILLQFYHFYFSNALSLIYYPFCLILMWKCKIYGRRFKYIAKH